MPYTKEQLRIYWQTHKEQINFQRREKRRLARLATEKVSYCEASQKQTELKMANPKTANPQEVSHGKPTGKPDLVNPTLTKLIHQWQTATNYSCSPTCFYSYCSNCWYFVNDQLVNYKGLLKD